jgi:hypothetical protein
MKYRLFVLLVSLTRSAVETLRARSTSEIGIFQQLQAGQGMSKNRATTGRNREYYLGARAMSRIWFKYPT